MAIANVLIVDDEVEFSGVIAERMRNRDLSVDTADSGMRAIEMVQKKSYDAVILDLAMPEMDGIQTLKRLLELDHNLQIIMLTGQATIQQGVEAVKLGAADFIEKPADLDTLMIKVDEAHRKRMLLFEKDLDGKMSAIMKKKGW